MISLQNKSFGSQSQQDRFISKISSRKRAVLTLHYTAAGDCDKRKGEALGLKIGNLARTTPHKLRVVESTTPGFLG